MPKQQRGTSRTSLKGEFQLSWKQQEQKEATRGK